jgi:hypothetical protein
VKRSSNVPEDTSEFRASGGSPPRRTIPPALVEELAEIIADALVADCEGDLAKPCAATPAGSSPAPTTEGAAC